jgi:hypothetical protein
MTLEREIRGFLLIVLRTRVRPVVPALVDDVVVPAPISRLGDATPFLTGVGMPEPSWSGLLKILPCPGESGVGDIAEAAVFVIGCNAGWVGVPW